MKSLRIQLAVIIVLWALAEGWFAYYWWGSPHFSESFPSVGIPVATMAMVMIAWALLRCCAIGWAGRSIEGRFLGIALVLTAAVLGGFVPLWVSGVLAESDVLNASFHGEAGWPSFISSLFLWLLGAMYFLVCLVEILETKSAKQPQSHH